MATPAINLSSAEFEERRGALAAALGDALRTAGETLATAESCTGGGLGAAITSVSGSSDYYLGGIVSYSNAAKVALLGVHPDTLAAHGAVSAETAREMARGALARLDADRAVSVTGIAGPGGGSEEKPVGLVFIGVAGRLGIEVAEHRFTGDRRQIRAASVMAALAAALAAVLDIPKSA